MLTDTLSDEELQRYSRHILLPQIDFEGQERLKASSVMIIGLGGLGSPVAQYLAAAGVGKLILIDADQVDLTNLQRQTIYATADVGKAKVLAAKARLAAINPAIQVDVVESLFDPDTALSLLQAHTPDVVVDCTDNHTTRRCINASCVKMQVGLVIGSAIGFTGQLLTVLPNNNSTQADQTLEVAQRHSTPCYSCLHRGNPVDEVKCAEMGVFSPILGLIGSLQAAEALKILLGLPVTTAALWLYDGLNVSRAPDEPLFQRIGLRYWSECPDCLIKNI